MRWADDALASKLAMLVAVLRKVLPFALLVRNAQVAYQPKVMPPLERPAQARKGVASRTAVLAHGETTLSKMDFPLDEGVSHETKPSISSESKSPRPRSPSLKLDDNELPSVPQTTTLDEVTAESRFELSSSSEEKSSSFMKSEFDGTPDVRRFHVSEFSEELRSFPVQLAMLELLSAPIPAGISSIHMTAGEEAPVIGRMQVDEKGLPRSQMTYLKDGESVQISRQSESGDWRSSTEEAVPKHPDMESEPVSVTKARGARVGEEPAPEPSKRTGLAMSYLPLIAAQASIPIASAVSKSRASMPVAQKVSSEMAHAPSEIAHPSTESASAPSPTKIGLAPGKEPPRPKVVPYGKEEHPAGTGIQLDEVPSSKLKKEDVVGSKGERPTEHQVTGYDEAGVPSVKPDYGEGSSPSSGVSEIQTEVATAPLLFAIGPLVIEQMAMIRGTTVEREAPTVIGMPPAMLGLDRIPEPRPGALSQASDEPSGAPEVINTEEGTPEPRSGSLPPFESKEDWRGYIAPIAMIESAIAMTLPPWVDRTIRAPPFSFAMDVTGLPTGHLRPRPPVETGRAQARKEPSMSMPEESVELAIGPPSIDTPKSSGLTKGVEREAERPLSERDVVRIVKRWMEEDAARKGFM